MRGFLLTPTYRVVDGVAEVQLYGVLESGEPCVIADDRTWPYFFVPSARVPEVRALAAKAVIESTSLLSLAGEAVARVSVPLPGDVPGLRSRLENRGIACFEADVRFAYRYLIDRGIRGAFEVDGPFQHHERLGRVYRNPDLQPCHWLPRLKVLSIDIETDKKADQLYSIALCTNDFERCIVINDNSFTGADHVPSEKAALRRFLEYMREIDPDVITGWNVVDFDLACLARIAHRHGVHFAIGRGDERFDLRKDASFTRESRAVVFGRQVLDGLALLRGAFIKLEDYKLETAAQTFLGKGKLITGDNRHTEIDFLYHNDPQHLIDYNLQDARLVLELLAKVGLIDLAIERSLLTGMQLDRVSAAIASVDSLYLNALRPRGFVAPSVHIAEPTTRLSGGYVMESKPGLYENVLVFDFKSLYPSIIRTFNLDPLTLVRAPGDDVSTVAPIAMPAPGGDGTGEGRFVEAPNGARFRRDLPGILPHLLTQLAEERQQAKSLGNTVKANAVKILMNSFYGVLGATASRLFSPDVANAVTTFGQYLIQHAANYARRHGYEVLYGDTDSLFILSRLQDPEAALALGERLCNQIGDDVAAMIRRQFECDSALELELEKLYRRFFLPEVRGGAVGSKKRYAGLLDKAGREEIEFVGLESVRRDWSAVSKHFQFGLLQRVFHDQPVDDFIRAFLVDLRAGKFDAQLIYKKAIRKDLRAYTKTTPPHVKAARKQASPGGRIVVYLMTTHGPEPVENVTAPPDYDHYIEHQLEPIADAILPWLGKTFASIARPSRQLSLF